MKVFFNKKPAFFLLCIILITSNVPADPDINDYDYVASELFWNELYTFGGWTLYCGYRFESDRKTKNGKGINIEHIYPASLMFRHAGCNNRMQCRDSDNSLYKNMEADMHNMYPVWNALITYRYNKSFGVVSGEEWRFEDCDIEWKSDVLEPRQLARGNIARAIFYMHTKYGVQLEPAMIDVLKTWNRLDPPSDQERARNDKIEELQGQRNPYIDDPTRAKRIPINVRR